MEGYMSKKFYAVKKGFKKGIFKTWNECKKQVDGYSGAVYKAFTNYEEAYEFIGMNKSLSKDSDSKNKLVREFVEAYVDGSYSAEKKMYSYGVVILCGNLKEEFSGKGNDEENLSMRNVAGELLGAMEAIKWAVKNKKNDIKIYYDYEGIEKWALGLWKTNKKGTKAYKEFIDGVKGIININFIKVKAHSGVYYNEEADRLAKAELSISSSLVIEREERDYQDVLRNFIAENIEVKTKNKCSIILDGKYINEEKLKKLAKEIWRMNKRKISEIDRINNVLNIDEKILVIEITDKYKNIYNYKIDL